MYHTFDPGEPEYRRTARFFGQAAEDEMRLSRYAEEDEDDDWRDPPARDPDCPACGEPIDGVAVEYEPDDPDYGADADGHRGTFVPGDTYVSAAPDTCPSCGVALRFDCDRAGNVTAYRVDEEDEDDAGD